MCHKKKMKTLEITYQKKPINKDFPDNISKKKWITLNYYHNVTYLQQKPGLILKIFNIPIQILETKQWPFLYIYCAKYLITVWIQSAINLKWCVHTWLKCSGFDLCVCIKLHPFKHFITLARKKWLFRLMESEKFNIRFNTTKRRF